jgi:hypothetical protein
MLDPLRLTEMSVIVQCDDLKSGSDGESHQRHERIPESHAVFFGAL